MWIKVEHHSRHTISSHEALDSIVVSLHGKDRRHPNATGSTFSTNSTSHQLTPGYIKEHTHTPL
jgi:hypothetical protein